jgi:hypothetical protein
MIATASPPAAQTRSGQEAFVLLGLRSRVSGLARKTRRTGGFEHLMHSFRSLTDTSWPC